MKSGGFLGDRVTCYQCNMNGSRDLQSQANSLSLSTELD